MKPQERRQMILQTLNERRYVKIMNLAAEFGVSERTIIRDVAELTLTYPLEAQQGRYGGGVRLQDGFYLGRKYLRPNQQRFLQKLSQTLSGEDLTIVQSILSDFSPGNVVL